MKRSPLRRGKPLARGSGLLRRSRLSPRSEAALAALGDRADALMVVRARSGGRCEVCPKLAAVGAPTPPLPHNGSEGHEPFARGRGGDPGDPDQILWTCRWGHEFAHGFPLAAREAGVLRSEW